MLILRDYDVRGRGRAQCWSDGGTDGLMHSTRGLYSNPTTNTRTQQLKITVEFNENRQIFTKDNNQNVIICEVN